MNDPINSITILRVYETLFLGTKFDIHLQSNSMRNTNRILHICKNTEADQETSLNMLKLFFEIHLIVFKQNVSI